MAKIIKFVHIVILFVFLLLVLVAAESKLGVIYIIYLIDNILLLLMIFIFSLFTLQNILLHCIKKRTSVLLMMIAVNYFQVIHILWSVLVVIVWAYPMVKICICYA